MTRVITETTNYSSTLVSGNAGFKLMFGRALALILGGYYNHYYTNPMGLSPMDYGAAAGLGLTLPMGPGLGLYISPMYHYALAKQTFGTSSNLTASEVVGFVGFIIGGGGRSR